MQEQSKMYLKIWRPGFQLFYWVTVVHLQSLAFNSLNNKTMPAFSLNPPVQSALTTNSSKRTHICLSGLGMFFSARFAHHCKHIPTFSLRLVLWGNVCAVVLGCWAVAKRAQDVNTICLKSDVAKTLTQALVDSGCAFPKPNPFSNKSTANPPFNMET